MLGHIQYEFPCNILAIKIRHAEKHHRHNYCSYMEVQETICPMFQWHVCLLMQVCKC